MTALKRLLVAASQEQASFIQKVEACRGCADRISLELRPWRGSRGAAGGPPQGLWHALAFVAVVSAAGIWLWGALSGTVAVLWQKL